MLTARQKAALDFISGHIEANGAPPSYDEMCEALRLKSKGNMTRILDCLVERGHITRLKNKRRSVQLVRVAGRCSEQRPGHPQVSRKPLLDTSTGYAFFKVHKEVGHDCWLEPMGRKP